MRDFYLTEEIQHYWKIIDPYFNNEKQRDLYINLLISIGYGI